MGESGWAAENPILVGVCWMAEMGFVGTKTEKVTGVNGVSKPQLSVTLHWSMGGWGRGGGFLGHHHISVESCTWRRPACLKKRVTAQSMLC